MTHKISDMRGSGYECCNLKIIDGKVIFGGVPVSHLEKVHEFGKKRFFRIIAFGWNHGEIALSDNDVKLVKDFIQIV